jgi:hypothetical protein
MVHNKCSIGAPMVVEDKGGCSVATRFSVNFSEEANETLEEIAERRGVTKTDVLRGSIALEKWFDETRRDGGKILVQTKDGEIREVITRD